MNYILAFIAFNVIVIAHELGHFLAAKRFGIKVEEFSLFVGPKLWSTQRGETTYSIRLFPIMAYVKMEGEEEASTSERAFNNKPRYARALTAFGGPLANLLLAAVLLTIMFSIQGFPTTELSVVDKESSAYASGLREGDRITKYAGKPVYMPLDVAQFIYVSKGKPAEVEYVREGVKDYATITPRIVPETKAYRLGVTFEESTGGNSNVIGTIAAGQPADTVGLRVGDRIVKINDVSISNRDDVVSFMEKNKTKEVSITALRDSNEINVNLIPNEVKVPEQYLIGVYFLAKKGNLLESFGEAVKYAYSISRSVVYSLVWLLTGQVGLNQMMGPIGMVSSMGEALQQAPSLMDMMLTLLEITGLMSIAIGATNLIPFPMLDGNRLLLIGIEAIRRKPLKPEREAFISMVGFVLIILIAVYAAFNDIMRLVNA